MSEPIPKRAGQRDKILTWLQMRGAKGVLNTELNEICLRYGARIHELRAAGHDIRTERLDDSRFRFVLVEPDTSLTRETLREALRLGNEACDREVEKPSQPMAHEYRHQTSLF